MTALPYQQALERIRAEYREMPGMRLTATQVQRLTGVEESVCAQVLEALVKEKFPSICADETYILLATDRPSRFRDPKANWRVATVSRRFRAPG